MALRKTSPPVAPDPLATSRQVGGSEGKSLESLSLIPPLIERSSARRGCVEVPRRGAGSGHGGANRGRAAQSRSVAASLRMQQALNFLPEPQGHGSLRPT